MSTSGYFQKLHLDAFQIQKGDKESVVNELNNLGLTLDQLNESKITFFDDDGDGLFNWFCISSSNQEQLPSPKKALQGDAQEEVNDI